MKMSYSIAVPQPCDEDWNEMTPRGCGRFCAACEKTVVDFTSFSDEDFVAYFKKNGINTCGRFSSHQFALEIPWLDTNQQQPMRNLWSKTLAYAALSLLPAVLPASASGLHQRTVQHAAHPGIITGTVLDEQGEAIPGVSVAIKGTTYGTVTDADGHFELQAQNSSHVLEFIAMGMKTCTREVKDITQSVAVTLAIDRDTELCEVDIYNKHSSQVGAAGIGQKKISGIPVTDITKALEGSAPGVSSYANMGIPSSTPSIILFDNLPAKPLIVLNGKRYTGNITDIDPNTIKKLKLLKDKDALKKYGAKGANGVIIIDTKDITLWERLTRHFRKK